MQEVVGDIWNYRGKAVIAITSNGTVLRGRAVLGRGVARQAAEFYPRLAEALGHLVAQRGNHVHVIADGIVCFPVEETAWDWPDLRIIERSARELKEAADRGGWKYVVVPRPGCGGGGLVWKEVRPLLEPHFDSRFLVIRPAEVALSSEETQGGGISDCNLMP